MGYAATIRIESGWLSRPAWTRCPEPERLGCPGAFAPVSPDGSRRIPVARSAPPGVRDLKLQPGYVRLKIVQPQHERIDPARLHLCATLTPVHQQSQVAGGVVLPAPKPEELDLEFPLI